MKRKIEDMSDDEVLVERANLLQSLNIREYEGKINRILETDGLADACVRRSQLEELRLMELQHALSCLAMEKKLKEAALKKVEEDERTIFTEGLPPLDDKVNAPKTPSHGEGDVCEFDVCDFGLYSRDIIVRPRFPGSYVVNPSIPNSGEVTVAMYSFFVLRDIVRGLGLEDLVKISLEMVVAFDDKTSLRPDAWLLHRKMISGSMVRFIPIGVEECKQSLVGHHATSILDDKKCIGEVFDYMQVLRMHFGVQRVFGILSTYDEWRICWLTDSDDLALSTESSTVLVVPHVIPEEDFKAPFVLIPGSTKDIVEAPDKADMKLPNPLERNCHVSKVYLRTDPELILALATVIRKMYESPIEQPPFLSGKRLYQKLNTRNVLFVPRPFSTLHLGEFGGKAKELFVLYVFGSGGGDGRACLAADQKGRCCVIKFYRPARGSNDAGSEIARDFCEKEAEAWRAVWNLPAITRKEQSRWVVVMKYVRLFSSFLDAEQCGVSRDDVKTAVDRVVACGYEHTDLSWMHVGMYMEGNQKRIVFIDLSPSRFIKMVDDATQTRLRMMNVLYG